MQDQAGLNIHPGGKTALSMLGKAHYIELSQKTVTLFGSKDNHLPLWFKNYDWGLNVHFHKSSFLPRRTRACRDGAQDLQAQNFRPDKGDHGVLIPCA